MSLHIFRGRLGQLSGVARRYFLLSLFFTPRPKIFSSSLQVIDINYILKKYVFGMKNATSIVERDVSRSSGVLGWRRMLPPALSHELMLPESLLNAVGLKI
jgi:hypothetical protein